VKKSKIGKPKSTNTPEPTEKAIPLSISAPPPASKRVAKVTNVDHLTDLAYNISAVIGPRDRAENDALLTLLSLKRKNKVRRKRQERKLRRLAMTREKERIDFQDKLYLAKDHKVVDTSRRDLTDRKAFVSTLSSGNGTLTTFIDNQDEQPPNNL